MLVVGFEFEYANIDAKIRPPLRPSLTTTSGNVPLQTFGIPSSSSTSTTGGGLLPRASRDDDEETALPAEQRRRREDQHRAARFARASTIGFSTCKGNPRHKTVQRIYAGVNLRSESRQRAEGRV